MADWWEYEKPAGSAGTHAAGDDGEDLSTPDHTPVHFPWPGTVIDAHHYVYGGQVVVKVDGAPYDEYAIHLNNINVKQGDYIYPGTLIGDTGGGVGDLVLKNGSVQPATSMADYHGHSTGYHSEFGAFRDDSPHGDMNQFNQGWGHPNRQIDPRPIVDALHAGQNVPPLPGGTLPGTPGGTSSSSQDNGFLGIPGAIDRLGQTLNPANWGANIGNTFLKAAGFDNAQNALLRVTVGAAGVGLMLGGVWIALEPEAQAAAVQVAKVAKVAAI